MPQAKLPDINNAWVKYRGEGLDSIQLKDYAGAIGAVMASNALFPDGYRCKVDTDAYNKIMREEKVLCCPSCTEESKLEGIKIYDLLLNPIQNLIVGSTTTKMWECPKCEKPQTMTKTKLIKNQHAKPFYHGIISEPPKRREGIIDRKNFHHEMIRWFYNSMEQIEYQLGRYRDEYKPSDESLDGNIFMGDEDAD